eukprot:15444658-Alexandrium_andersonii.AAC.1
MEGHSRQHQAAGVSPPDVPNSLPTFGPEPGPGTPQAARGGLQHMFLLPKAAQSSLKLLKLMRAAECCLR